METFFLCKFWINGKWWEQWRKPTITSVLQSVERVTYWYQHITSFWGGECECTIYNIWWPRSTAQTDGHRHPDGQRMVARQHCAGQAHPPSSRGESRYCGDSGLHPLRFAVCSDWKGETVINIHSIHIASFIVWPRYYTTYIADDIQIFKASFLLSCKF